MKIDKMNVFMLILTSGVSGWFITVPFRVPNYQIHSGIIAIGLMFGFFIVYSQWVLSKNLSKVPRVFKTELVIFVVYLVAISFLGRTNIALEKDASVICNSAGNPNASMYSTSKGIHPIMIIYTSNGRGLQSKDYPANWIPKKMADLQLVACLEDNWITVESCPYIGNNTILRLQETMKITVYNAQSRQIIDKFELTGGTPGACEYSESFGTSGGARVRRQGSGISGQVITSQLEHIVNP
jgi:hypothetical protein